KAGQVAQAVAKVGGAVVRIAFLGVGDRSPRELRKAGGELGRLLQPGDRAVSSVVTGQPDDQVRAFAEGVLLGSYRYSEKSGAAADQVRDAELKLLVSGSDPALGSPSADDSTVSADAIDEAVIVATAVALARDLTNTPSLRKSPQWLADAA